MRLLVPVLFTIALSALGCANVYKAPNLYSVIKDDRVIAVLPPRVTIAARRKVDAEAIAAQQVLESQNFQNAISDWLLKRKMQGRLMVDVMNVNEVNVLLDRAGYTADNPGTPAEMAAALGVDAVITGTFQMDKPMSTGGGIAAAVLLGYSNTNQIAASLKLIDQQSGDMLWSYSHTMAGGIGSSPQSVTTQLMRNASKKLPYTAPMN